MLTTQYTAIVKGSRLLELPVEAQELHLEPGQEVMVHLDAIDAPASEAMPPNETLIAVLDVIEKRQKGRRHTDGSQTDAIIRQGRAGAMYGIE